MPTNLYILSKKAKYILNKEIVCKGLKNGKAEEKGKSNNIITSVVFVHNRHHHLCIDLYNEFQSFYFQFFPGTLQDNPLRPYTSTQAYMDHIYPDKNIQV